MFIKMFKHHQNKYKVFFDVVEESDFSTFGSSSCATRFMQRIVRYKANSHLYHHLRIPKSLAQINGIFLLSITVSKSSKKLL